MSAAVLMKTTEQLVNEMWFQALGPKGRGSTGRILDISVGLQRMFRFLGDIDKTFGIKIPPTIAMQLGSVHAIANAIDMNVWPSPSSLVLLRDGDCSEVLCVIAAGSGVVLELCDLAQMIKFRGQIYGLQLPGLAGEAEPLTSIPAIADYYREVISRHVAASKIHVIGYSFGGLVALELAKALKREGHCVGLVGVLDSTCYEKYWPRLEWLKTAVKRIKRKLGEMRKTGSLADSLSFAAHCLHLAKLYVLRRLGPSDGGAAAEESAYYIGGLDPNFQKVRNASIAAFEKYDPPFYDGKIVLFRSQFGDPHACDPLAIWKHKTAEMKLVHVSGTHATMIRRPFVQTLADEVSICLDE